MERFTVALPNDTARWLKDRAARWRCRRLRMAGPSGGTDAARRRNGRRRPRPECESIGEALNRYIDAGPGLRRRLAGREDAGDRPLSLVLQERLYDERGLPD